MLFKTFIATSALSLTTLVAAAPSTVERPCGFKIAPCPANSVCIPNSIGCTDLNRCAGTCRPKPAPVRVYPFCGGHRPNPPQCDEKSECLDDPRIPDSCGMACDAPGICIPKDVKTCGGFIGKPCPKGYQCYDKPNDGCDPKHGGADCIGICL